MNIQERMECERRWRRFDGPLKEVIDNNPLCYRIAQHYASGGIVEYEEALAQMVVHLAKDWKEEQRRAIELMQTHCFTTPFLR